MSEDSTFLPRMGLGILMARTPRDVEVSYTDEVLSPFDFTRSVKDVDLVGISVDSKTARRSYQIARAYRERGVPVVLGGIHVSACPEEALGHADSVVVGEADVIWPRVIEDFRAGRLKPLYRPELPDLADMPVPRRDLFTSKRYIPFQTVQTMRGCPYPCEFCSVSTANGKTFRFRPVDHVIEELRGLGKLIMFSDDNVMIHREYSAELFRRMAPLKKHWIGQCSLATVRKIDNVKLMADSGCKALFIGFESIDDSTLRHTAKPQNRPGEYREVVSMLHDHGISVWGSFVFGFDTDTCGGVRPHGGRSHRHEAHAGELRYLDALPGNRTVPAATLGGPLDPSGVVARGASRPRFALFRAQAHDSRAAPRRLGASMDTVLPTGVHHEALSRGARVELDSVSRLPALERDAAPLGALQDRRGTVAASNAERGCRSGAGANGDRHGGAEPGAAAAVLAFADADRGAELRGATVRGLPVSARAGVVEDAVAGSARRLADLGAGGHVRVVAEVAGRRLIVANCVHTLGIAKQILAARGGGSARACGSARRAAGSRGPRAASGGSATTTRRRAAVVREGELVVVVGAADDHEREQQRETSHLWNIVANRVGPCQFAAPAQGPVRHSCRDFVSRNSSSPWWPNSRPSPDCL